MKHRGNPFEEVVPLWARRAVARGVERNFCELLLDSVGREQGTSGGLARDVADTGANSYPCLSSITPTAAGQVAGCMFFSVVPPTDPFLAHAMAASQGVVPRGAVTF